MAVMKNFTSEELDTIIENHRHWLLSYYSDKCESMRANLSYADLSYANFEGVDLEGAVLSYADLRGANLKGSDFKGADFSHAFLKGADLRGVELSNADLRGADLSYACLRRADLSYADLRGANLGYAGLSNADLKGADLSETKNVPYIPMICPEEGSFIGWKKAYYDDVESNTIKSCLVKLFIPEDAKRSSYSTRKCRCDKAQVLGIYSLDGSESPISAFSYYDSNFVYKTNEIISIDNFDENRWRECSTGIHFFINRQEAINYEF